MQQYYLSTIYILLEYEYISLAIIRSVSLRLQNEGQKNSRIITDAHGVFDTDFFDLFFFFRCKGILNGFASVTACGCREVNSLISKKTFFIFFTLTLTLILHFLSSRKRSRLQIRFKSICKSKNKGQKIRVKDSVCICAIREPFLTFVL